MNLYVTFAMEWNHTFRTNHHSCPIISNIALCHRSLRNDKTLQLATTIVNNSTITQSDS